MSMVEDTRKALDAASLAYNRLIGRTRRVRVTTPSDTVAERPALPEPAQADAEGPSDGGVDNSPRGG